MHEVIFGSPSRIRPSSEMQLLQDLQPLRELRRGSRAGSCNSRSRIGRTTNRRLRIEALESRDLLAAVVDGLGLVDDTGVSDTDLLTRDGRISGEVSWTSPDTTAVVLEFDHTGDGQPEGTAVVSESGSTFEYDPVSHDQVLSGWEGPLSLRYRTVAHQSGGTVTGNWSAFDFTLDRMAPAAVSFSPAPDATVYARPSEITAVFDEPLDPDSVSSQSVTLIGVNTGAVQPSSVGLSGDRNVVATIDASLIAPGQYTTTATAVTDLAGNTTLLQFSANWQYIAPPETSGIANVQIAEDSPDTQISLYDAFQDIETADANLTFAANYDTQSILFDSVQIDSATGILTLDYADDAYGATDITVQATDEDDLSVSTTFIVAIDAVNDAPVIVEFVGIEGPTVWTFEGVVEDDDLTNAVVVFGGLLDGATTAVQPDGKFFYTATITEDGIVTATARDAEGLTSPTKYYVVHIT